MSDGSLLLLLLSLKSCLPPSTWPLGRGHKPPNRGLWPLHAHLLPSRHPAECSFPQTAGGLHATLCSYQFLSLHHSPFLGLPATLEPNADPPCPLPVLNLLFACLFIQSLQSVAKDTWSIPDTWEFSTEQSQALPLTPTPCCLSRSLEKTDKYTYLKAFMNKRPKGAEGLTQPKKGHVDHCFGPSHPASSATHRH